MSKKLIILLTLLPCAEPIMAMKTVGAQLVDRSQKRQKIECCSTQEMREKQPKKINLHAKVKHDKLYSFATAIEFKGADVNKREEGFPLIFTIQNADIPEERKDMYFEILGERKELNWNATTPRETTLLHSVSEKGNAKRVGQFLQWGADPNVEDPKGLKPHDYIDFYFDREGADPKRVLELLCDAGADLNAPNVYGKTALFFTDDNEEHTKSLLLWGADPEIKDHKGRMAYEYIQEKDYVVNPILKDRESVKEAIMPVITQVTGSPAQYLRYREIGNKMRAPQLTFGTINR